VRGRRSGGLEGWVGLGWVAERKRTREKGCGKGVRVSEDKGGGRYCKC